MATDEGQQGADPVGRRNMLRGGLLAGAGVAAASAAVLARPAVAAASTPATVINVTDPPYNAKGYGGGDNKKAFQAALNDLISAGGGVLYVPGGNYELDSGLTWDSSNTLKITGDGQGVSNIRMNCPTAPYSCFEIKNAEHFVIEDVSFLADQDPHTYTGQYVAVSLVDVIGASFHRFSVQTGKSRRVNQGIVTSGGGNIDIDDCDIRAYVNCCQFSSGTANVTIRSSQLFLNTGSGVPTASCVLCDSTMATIRMMGVTTNSGERGFYWEGGARTHDPQFAFLWDVEVNNPTVCGMQFDTGAEVWMTSCWVTNVKPSTSPLHGAYFSPTFTGLVRMSDCTFGGWSGHDIWLDGGNGYAFSGLCIGSSRKHSANAWDGVHVGLHADNVTFTGCHFNADAYSNIAFPAPRSAVYVESTDSNVSVVGCIASKKYYGKSALVGPATQAGNINI